MSLESLIHRLSEMEIATPESHAVSPTLQPDPPQTLTVTAATLVTFHDVSAEAIGKAPDSKQRKGSFNSYNSSLVPNQGEKNRATQSDALVRCLTCRHLKPPRRGADHACTVLPWPEWRDRQIAGECCPRFQQ